MRRILTITLNPAIDITTAVGELAPGRKLRCETPRIDPGGGGVNVSRMINELGGATTALVAVGGATGELMRTLLGNAGIEAVFLDADGMTRQSFAVHDNATAAQYRFVLPGPTQNASFADRALATVNDLLTGGDFPYVVASGSLPPGVSENFYGDLAEVVRAQASRLILDTSGPGLRAALGRGVFLLRTNRIEARELATGFVNDPDDPQGLARSLLESGAAEFVIITLGADGMLMASKSGMVRIESPRVDVVSPVGAGDSFVGALGFALCQAWPLERACSYGVASAAAAMMTEATELAHKQDVDRLHALIENNERRVEMRSPESSR